MRNRNNENGLEATVIMGAHGALISIRITNEALINKPDFLGFEIKRDDLTENESYPLKGFKYFTESEKPLINGQLFDTDKQPIQSFYWEDYTVKHMHDYVYHVIPVYGAPKNLRYGAEVGVRISSENDESAVHSIYFNMGVAGSLAYARRFNDQRPDQMTEAQKAEVRVWLSRGLEEALLGFIQKAIDGKLGLRAAFYEFTYPPVLLKLKEAVAAGCDVQIIYDSRKEKTENDEAITAAELPRTIHLDGQMIQILTPRTKDPQVPSHNKFMILLDGDQPTEVWTGSVNITDKGILGHSNVGHQIADVPVARQYLAYWNALVKDPDQAVFPGETEQIQSDLTKVSDFTENVTVFFSPREKKTILKTYGAFIESAEQMVCGIFPFSFSKDMKASLSKASDGLKYLMVDKIGNADGIVKDHNTLIVNGAYFTKPMFNWLREINSGFLLNKNHNPGIGTNYVHNKLLLIDPLSAHPVIIVGSANFSDASVVSNDENTIVIKGGPELRRVCDIYFTEFYRLFHHFFVRKATQEMNPGAAAADGADNPLHLKTDNSWVARFRADSIKVKMQGQLSGMPLDYGV